MQTVGIYKFCNYSYNKSSQNFIASNISDHFLSFIVSVGPDDDSLGWVILVWHLSGDAFSWWLGSFQRLLQSSVWCRTGKNWVSKVMELWGPLRCLCPFMVSLYSFSNLVASRSPDFLWKQETREVSGPQGLRGIFLKADPTLAHPWRWVLSDILCPGPSLASSYFQSCLYVT